MIGVRFERFSLSIIDLESHGLHSPSESQEIAKARWLGSISWVLLEPKGYSGDSSIHRCRPQRPASSARSAGLPTRQPRDFAYLAERRWLASRRRANQPSRRYHCLQSGLLKTRTMHTLPLTMNPSGKSRSTGPALGYYSSRSDSSSAGYRSSALLAA